MTRKDGVCGFSGHLGDPVLKPGHLKGLEQAGEISISADQFQRFNEFLGLYICDREFSRDRPNLKQVEASLSELEMAAKMLHLYEEHPDLAGKSAFLRIRAELGDMQRHAKINLNTLASSLAQLAIAAGRAKEKIAEQLKQDRGGPDTDWDKVTLLLSVSELFDECGGKPNARERFIQALCAHLPRASQPALPRGKGSINRLIDRHKATFQT